MYPTNPPQRGPGRRAEGLLFEALRDQLPGDFHVYHGFRFVEEEEAREGEVDFLVVHRTLGMLGLECKGFGVRRTATGEWVRSVDGGADAPLARSPFEQAERNIHVLVKALQPKLALQFSRGGSFPLPFGYAVAFPLAELTDGKLPPEAPREIVLDCRDMARAGEKVQAAMRFWLKAHPAESPRLDDKDFERFRRHILLPKLKMAMAPGAELAALEGTLVRLTDEQSWVADALLENRLFRVSGGAGTGKTVIALEMVRRLAEAGNKTLVLCFNRALAARLDAAVKGWGLDPGQARATYFHRLCEEAFQADGAPFVEPEGEGERLAFYNHEAPERLFRALDRGLLPRWDAVVVDEGQDFAASWWGLIETRLSDGGSGRRYVFYDPLQSIFGRECSVPPYPVLRLSRGVRSTRRITEYAAGLGDPALTPHAHCPEGSPVELLAAANESETRKAVAGIVRRLTKAEGYSPDQIVVLSPHRPEHSSLAGVKNLDGVPLSSLPNRVQGAICHTTISAFKGLESDAVIVIDADSSDPRCDPGAQYVAASRARHFLAFIRKKPDVS
jgi:hypothetical protein